MMFTEGLNAEQARAVVHGEGPLVVYAGAGSGKTRVITHRIAHLIGTLGVSPFRIMAVTFTNKAAREMRDRLHTLLGPDAQDVWMGTFHSTCAKLLRLYSDECGVDPRFVIYDDSDQRSLVTRIIRSFELDEKQYDPKSVAHAINKYKQECITVDQIKPSTTREGTIAKIYEQYQNQLNQARALDFDDLILRVVIALEKNPLFRTKLEERFHHVLVDEFQDTNRVQFQLVAGLAHRRGNICVVGDDDQSIYRWRGADRRNILDFNRTFVGAEVIKLEQNYRSTQRILRSANAVISKGYDREPKELWTDNPEGEPVQVISCIDEHHEAERLVTAVRELRMDGYSLSDIAVLYRIHAQSRVFEETLRAHNLPYKVLGGVRFYDRAEVKDVLAYLRFLENPNDDISLFRIINTPARGIGKTTVERVVVEADQHHISAWEALLQVVDNPSTPNAARTKLAAFAATIQNIKESQARADNQVSKTAEAVLEHTGYASYLAADPSIENITRWQNIQELLGSMQEFDKDHAFVTEENLSALTAFLERVTLQSEPANQDGSADVLTLMTVHAAKGLEFPAVMVAGLEESLFPFKGWESLDDAEELDEERRLAYVAFTRAKKKLMLSHASSRRIFGQLKTNRPSRFVLELPMDDIQQLGVRPSQMPQSPRPSQYPHFGLEPPRAPMRSTTDTYIDYDDASESEQGVKRGMRVRHSKFGVGRVQAISPESSPPKATVTFPEWGTRQIVVTFLEPI